MTSLYRTYRPATFEEVVGQKRAVTELRALIASGNMPHSLVLVGSRGIGKTTLARIVAHELGCQSTDIYELDAASNNSVDDIRDLREEITTLPLLSPYKIYILDEVHMLSKQAWNAFLKTLEEPPSHVLFIMATTEVHSVPDTILSRSRTIRLDAPTSKDIASFVSDIAAKESHTLEADTAEIIAISANGSYRDALVSLQAVLVNEAYTPSAAASLLGVPAISYVRDWLRAVHSGNAGEAIGIIHTVEGLGADAQPFIQLAIERIRAALSLRVGLPVSMGTTADNELVEALVGGNPVNSQYLAHILDAMRMARSVPNPWVLVEIATYKMCSQ